jgi:hypothetical protein
LHPWKIGSAQWLNIHRQLVGKGSEIQLLYNGQSPGAGSRDEIVVPAICTRTG